MKYLMNGLSRVLGLTACFIVIGSLSGCKPTISFTALQTILTPGQDTELEWEVEFVKGSGDNVIEISPDIGVVELEGTITVAPTVTTTYKLSTRSFVFGFPMFIKEELTIEVEDGVCWDFTGQTVPDTCESDAEWDFYAANYAGDDIADYVFQSEKSAIVPDLGYQAVLLGADHDEPEELNGDPLIMFGNVRWPGLEDDTDYKVTLSVVYATAARRDVNDSDCEMPTIELSAFIGLEEPELEIDSDNDDFVSVINLSTKHILTPDITIADATDDTCNDDGVFEEDSASLTEVDVTTDSDGEFWITVGLTPSTPNMTAYLRSVTAIFEEQ
ncbi:hypothetical protein A9Q81_01165 [Gammaproteobacteria bacterium 42_54_T18]|nr:hypothetical protein A9Q81_01165 [Gammaproteobacteria bacterium 42_54_T18]